jgi:hypothetical protein
VEGLNEDAQWIILMGFIVSLSIFFLAIIINQSTLVGQTTAESVIEFPKTDIRDARSVILESQSYTFSGDQERISSDITNISLSRKGAIVYYTKQGDQVVIHYNNGVTQYDETW